MAWELLKMQNMLPWLWRHAYPTIEIINNTREGIEDKIWERG
jgi:hypothetical protein